MSTEKSTKEIKFSKKIVISCIVTIIIYTAVQTFLSCVIGMELTPTMTTCVYAFFGTELASCALIRIFDKEDKSKQEAEDPQSLDGTDLEQEDLPVG